MVMQVKEKYSLKHLNTFGIDVMTKYFVGLDNDREIKKFLLNNPYKGLPLLILGGGSNILFTKDFDGVVLKVNTKGIEIIAEDFENVFVKAKAGEVWNDFVNFCVEKNYGGIENLAMIPGCVGASPIQNIGAYGVEMKDTFHQLEAINIHSGEIKKFTKAECTLEYRDSIFKNELKGQYIILSVTFKLSKNPVVNISYGAIRKDFELMGIKSITIQEIRDAVCRIRLNKLPIPDEIANAGSFFKNYYISKKKFETLKNSYPDIPGFKTEHSCYKLASAWLIEQCGWKGKRIGDAGVHEKQALVLVNYGSAKGNEILKLANQIKNSVKEKFCIELETEVNII